MSTLDKAIIKSESRNEDLEELINFEERTMLLALSKESMTDGEKTPALTTHLTTVYNLDVT